MRNRYACRAPAGAHGDASVAAAALNTVPGKGRRQCDPQRPTSHTHGFPLNPSVLHFSHRPPLTSPAQSFTLFNLRCSTQLLLSRDCIHMCVACSHTLKHHSFLPAVCPFLPSHLITLLCQFPPHPFISLSCNLTPLSIFLLLLTPSLLCSLPLSDTQRGRSPSLPVPPGKHMLLFPSDSGVFERGGIV